MKKEIFKSVPNYPNYEVSNLGTVKSLNYNHTGKPQILKGGNSRGYQNVNLFKEGKLKNYKVHQLVIWAFKGVEPNAYKHTVDHVNEIKTDNRLENLEVVSQRENVSRHYKNKTDTTSQYMGVFFDKSHNKYKSQISIDGKQYYLGLSKDDEQCHTWYLKVLSYSNNHSNEETINYIKSKEYKTI